MEETYNGKFNDIPREAIIDYYEGAIKYNYESGRYGVTALMVTLSPAFIPYACLYLTLDKLLVKSD